MEKIKKLKKLIKRENLDGYLIPKNDEFFNEYVSNNNDRLDYISNFSGSFGFALILKNKNYLFVDGRYSLQAKNQSGKFFDVITVPNKMPYQVLKGKKLLIGFDSKIVTKKILSTFFLKSNCKFKPLKINLIDLIWKRKRESKIEKFYSLPSHSVGLNYKTKIKKIISYLKIKKADCIFISASENCAWTLNLRGRDVKYSPIANGYLIIDRKKNIKFFCDLKKISSLIKKKYKEVKFIELKSIQKILLTYHKKKFIIDNSTCSIFFEDLILKKNKILNYSDPIYSLKTIKSKKEIKNIKKTHKYDGVALTKYLFWLKRNFNKKKITEISASEKLYKFRKKNKNFKFSSFPTISASGPNGAIIHYKANKETNRLLKKGDIYLVDSGGQYEFGTTDVTRTVSLRNSNKRIKNIFTRVLKGHIAVVNYKLKKKTSGSEIDSTARKYLKQIGLNYSHGTGHGVGYFLNVHEGPVAISKNNKIKFQEGMVLSNEPGYYEKNKFGIRIENLIYVKSRKNNKYFENLTMVPIEKELIDKSLLNENEMIWLNNYHKKVFNYLKDFMNRKEKIELKKACSVI